VIVMLVVIVMDGTGVLVPGAHCRSNLADRSHLADRGCRWWWSVAHLARCRCGVHKRRQQCCQRDNAFVTNHRTVWPKNLVVLNESGPH